MAIVDVEDRHCALNLQLALTCAEAHATITISMCMHQSPHRIRQRCRSIDPTRAWAWEIRLTKRQQVKAAHNSVVSPWHCVGCSDPAARRERHGHVGATGEPAPPPGLPRSCRCRRRSRGAGGIRASVLWRARESLFRGRHDPPFHFSVSPRS
jgi:hypothetical protein